MVNRITSHTLNVLLRSVEDDKSRCYTGVFHPGKLFAIVTYSSRHGQEFGTLWLCSQRPDAVVTAWFTSLRPFFDC